MDFCESPEAREYFRERFGVPEEVLCRYRFLRRGKYVWAFSGTVLIPGRVEHAGIKALSLGGATPKPTTAFLRVIGPYATKNVVRVGREDALAFLRGEEVPGRWDATRGYVVVIAGNDVLGCGFYTGDSLRSMVPREYRMEDTWV